MKNRRTQNKKMDKRRKQNKRSLKRKNTRKNTRFKRQNRMKRRFMIAGAAGAPVTIILPDNTTQFSQIVTLNLEETHLLRDVDSDKIDFDNLNGNYVIDQTRIGGSAATYYKDTEDAKYMIKLRHWINKHAQELEVSKQKDVKERLQEVQNIKIPEIIYSDTEKGLIVMEYLNPSSGWKPVALDNSVVDPPPEIKQKNKKINEKLATIKQKLEDHDIEVPVLDFEGHGTDGAHIFERVTKNGSIENGIIDFGGDYKVLKRKVNNTNLNNNNEGNDSPSTGFPQAPGNVINRRKIVKAKHRRYPTRRKTRGAKENQNSNPKPKPNKN